MRNWITSLTSFCFVFSTCHPPFQSQQQSRTDSLSSPHITKRQTDGTFNKISFFSFSFSSFAYCQLWWEQDRKKHISVFARFIVIDWLYLLFTTEKLNHKNWKTLAFSKWIFWIFMALKKLLYLQLHQKFKSRNAKESIKFVLDSA